MAVRTPARLPTARSFRCVGVTEGWFALARLATDERVSGPGMSK